MYETVMVRGVKYPVGHKLYPIHSSMPGGPLVRVPGTVAAHQLYIGWSKVQIEPTERDHPTKPGVKQMVVKADPMPDGKPRIKLSAGPNGALTPRVVTYRWVYDPTPISVVLTGEHKYIRDAIEAGSLEVVTAKKIKGGGEA